MNTKYNIDRLIELSKTDKNKSRGVMLTNDRYALKEDNGGFYLCDGEQLLFTQPRVKRIISIYGDVVEDAIISVDYSIEDVPMFYSKGIKEAGLLPLNSIDIPNYFEVTDTLIIHNKYEDDVKAIYEEIKHEDSIYYSTKRMLNMVGNKF